MTQQVEELVRYVPSEGDTKAFKVVTYDDGRKSLFGRKDRHSGYALMERDYKDPEDEQDSSDEKEQT